MTTVDFFEALKQTSGTNDKKELLRQATDTEKKLLLYALDPNRNYYVSSKSFQPKVDGRLYPSEPDAIERFFKLLDQLNERIYTGHAAIEKLQEFFSMVSYEDAKLVYLPILFRDALGVEARLVNSVYKDLVPEFNVMLAPSKTPPLDGLRYPLMIQPKLDGLRAVVFYDPKEGIEVYSRTGKRLENRILVETLQQEVEQNLRGDLKDKAWVFDGEIYCHEWPFKRIYGAAATEIDWPTFDEALGTKHEFDPDVTSLKYFVWDMLTAEEWGARKTTRGYSDRYGFLRHAFMWPVGSIKLVDVEYAHGPDDVLVAQRRFLSLGYEGTMLKAADGLYRWKRCTAKSGELLKYKEFKSLDLRIIGYQEGEGKYKGTLGIFQVEFKGNVVGVGSGYTDAMRRLMWQNRDGLIGSIMEVKYFEETTDDQGKPSLRFPIFQRVRDDRVTTTEE